MQWIKDIEEQRVLKNILLATIESKDSFRYINMHIYLLLVLHVIL